MVRVLVVDDSPTQRLLLTRVLAGDPGIEVVGEAEDGFEALKLTRELHPDVIVMDVQMPGLDGFKTTRKIMRRMPTPIVICTGGAEVGEVELSMNALNSGAVIALPKPPTPTADHYTRAANHFRRIVKLMSEVTVAPRRFATESSLSLTGMAPLAVPPEMVAIAASTGGPAALHAVLSPLPADFPVPIVVVQHIAEGFAGGFARWMHAEIALTVKVAEDNEKAVPGTVYISPDDGHLAVTVGNRLKIKHTEPINGFRPSADVLFESVASRFGRKVVAVILTGMGEDGTQGLRSIHAAKGRIIAQDEASSVVWSMPKAVCVEGIADEVLDVHEIGTALMMSSSGSS